MKRLYETANLDYIFLDYPFAYLNEATKAMLDLAIYMDTPLDIAMARGVIRDYHELDVVSYMKEYLLHGRNVKASADEVVNGSLPVANIIKVVKEKIHFKKGSGKLVNKTK
ncbi:MULTISPECIES: hypothetical protein [Virgibacillus]|uniref:hypothetical protein n=2 Tax=Virgibacillus TaxID=84406 RepID=UPI00067E3DB8|nr:MULTISPECIES: hypothetical protein [Virgibacillus]MBS7426600.1 hypothetical protein [Virgibacillus sp. 19R1-5]MED3736430.1 hypothetical protein [Virgibacillus pantothenticus]QTY15579.1 hypothetical protein KBP50_17080 [Virgibacillus pantothenticus]SIS99771.1 hypothetical protein SAMN05421787_109112 [Virgibacillus pantothenticus]